jgi:hypothetical protein
VSNICRYETPKTVGDPDDVRAAVDETEYPYKSKGRRFQPKFSPETPSPERHVRRRQTETEACKVGSTRETVRMRILRGFLKSDEFGLGERQALRLEQQVVEIPVATAATKQRLDVSVHRFNYSHGDFGPAVIQNSFQVIE